MSASKRRLSEHLRPVDDLLEYWGDWVRREKANRPPNAPTGTTVLYRVMEQGPMGAASSGAPEPRIPEPILKIESAVGKIRGIYRTVIMIRYVHCANAPKEVRARRAKMSLRTWASKLEIARELVYQQLF